MSVRRFTGATKRDVMRQVREAFGDEALILSSRQTDEGTEIVAMPETAVEEYEQHATPADSAKEFSTLASQLLNEVHEMRQMLTTQQAGNSASKPTIAKSDNRKHLYRKMLTAGFTQELAQDTLAMLPPALYQGDDKRHEAEVWLKTHLTARLLTPRSEYSLFDRGGVIALIGPTGVGKTTTTAKLAANYVMRHGSDGLALVTTDSYRVGAQEQLRIYADILDVDMYALDDGETLESLRNKLRNKHLVMVDTVGMSQRDQRLASKVAELHHSESPTRFVLLLNAASQAETLDEVARVYRSIAREAEIHIDDCLLTKQDEAARLGPVLDTVIRQGFRLHFASVGQRVPEDLEPVNAEKLVTEALNVQVPAASAYEDPVEFSQSRTESWNSGMLRGQGRALSESMSVLKGSVGGFEALQQAWDLTVAEPDQQQPGLEQLTEQLSADPAHTMIWAREKPVAGCAWRMPDTALNDDSLPFLLPVRVAHEQEQLEQANQHLFQSQPTGERAEWLKKTDKNWLVTLNRNTRVLVDEGNQQKRVGVMHHINKSDRVETRSVYYRGHQVKLILFRKEAVFSLTGKKSVFWYGEVKTPAGTGEQVRRYWVTPEYTADEIAIGFILKQLETDELPSLARHGMKLLHERGLEGTQDELLLFIASAFSNLAVALEYGESAAYMKLRGQLMAMGGRNRQHNSRRLLEALVELFTARDAVRYMSRTSVTE